MRSCLEKFLAIITVFFGVAGFNMFVFGIAHSEGVLLLCIAGFTYMLGKGLEEKDDYDALDEIRRNKRTESSYDALDEIKRNQRTESSYDALDEIKRNQRTESNYDKSTNPETPVDSSSSIKRAQDERVKEIVENAGEIFNILRKKSQEVKEFREQQERIQKKMCDQAGDYTKPPIEEQVPDILQELDYKAETEQQEPIYGDPLKDIDGNVYMTVIIGDQLWMAENLRTTKYNDGTPIPHVSYDIVWRDLTKGAYCWYNDGSGEKLPYDIDPIDKEKSGALYNGYAKNSGKLCPEGWRVPTDNDWNKLIDYLGGKFVAGEKLRSRYVVGHEGDAGTDQVGFDALNYGYRDSNGNYKEIGQRGYWWSSGFLGICIPWYGYMWSPIREVDRYSFNNNDGISVRCIRERPINTQTLRIKTELRKPIYGEPLKDIDGNEYRTVRIGDQLWMAENLKTTRYNDGTSIPNSKDLGSLSKLNHGVYCWYENKIDYKNIFGALYNWQAVNTGKLSPKNWRVPTKSDWKKLTDYLGGEGIAGIKLKAKDTCIENRVLHCNSRRDCKSKGIWWCYLNRGVTNETGFSALPGGYSTLINGCFRGEGCQGYWWSSNEFSDSDARLITIEHDIEDTSPPPSHRTHAWMIYMFDDSLKARQFIHKKSYGLSVRCMLDID